MSKANQKSLGDVYQIELSEELEQCVLSRTRIGKNGLQSAEDVILDVLHKHFSRDLAKAKRERQMRDEAPLDRFLPQGVDPFGADVNQDEGLQLDFSLISQRSISRDDPKILRD